MAIGDPITLPEIDNITVSGACDGTADITIINDADTIKDATKIGGVRCGGDIHDGDTDGTTCTLTVLKSTGSFTGEWSS